jgi:hypothetical protein
MSPLAALLDESWFLPSEIGGVRMNPLYGKIVISGDVFAAVLELCGQKGNSCPIYVFMAGLTFQRTMTAIRIQLGCLIICGLLHLWSYNRESNLRSDYL